MQSNRRYFLGAAALASVSLERCNGVGRVNIGMIPDTGGAEVSSEEKAPLVEYLAATIDRHIKLTVPANYNATVEALGSGLLDFAYLGALTFVKAHDLYSVIPLVQREVDKQFHSVFITQVSSSIKSIEDLRRKTFAFGDINSTSGHLIPSAEMKQAGIRVERDLVSGYSGSHPATAKRVENGAIEAGALDETVYRSMVDAGRLSSNKIRIFHRSKPFVDYVWVARRDVDSGLCAAFTGAFLALSRPLHGPILEILRGNKFVRVNEVDYVEVRSLARNLKLL